MSDGPPDSPGSRLGAGISEAVRVSLIDSGRQRDFELMTPSRVGLAVARRSLGPVVVIPLVIAVSTMVRKTLNHEPFSWTKMWVLLGFSGTWILGSYILGRTAVWRAVQRAKAQRMGNEISP